MHVLLRLLLGVLVMVVGWQVARMPMVVAAVMVVVVVMSVRMRLHLGWHLLWN